MSAPEAPKATAPAGARDLRVVVSRQDDDHKANSEQNETQAGIIKRVPA